MTTHEHTKPEPHHGPKLKVYYSVFFSLTVLTVLTVAVSRIHLAPAAAVIIAFLIAISKASLVAAFFMHLKYDSRAIHLMAIMPTLLTVLIMMALMPDVGMAHGPLVAGVPEQRDQIIAAGSARVHGAESHGDEHAVEEEPGAGEEK